jgi:hypothetical protein
LILFLISKWTLPFDRIDLQSSTTPTTTSVSGKTNTKQPFLQNQEWIKFQQSIQVEGFQTGQMTKASVMLRKSKGGKQSRNRKAKELALLQQELRDSNGGAASNLASSDNRFPAIRYSPLETQELLKLAYETLPQKTGKRGSRNQKRQDQRWKDVRQIRKTYKQNIVAAHERKMEHRQWTRAQTKAVKEGAQDVCRQNVQYQATILQRWAATMYPTEPRGTSTTSPEIAAA